MILLPLALVVVSVLIMASLARRAALRRAEYEEELSREAAARGPLRVGVARIPGVSKLRSS
jgi:hypothetical protein